MELSRISRNIIKIIDEKYSEYFDEECLDIVQIKNICNLYKTKSSSDSCIKLSEINISSPDFRKIDGKDQKKNQTDVLKSKEFVKKYSFFIKILYACLKISVEIFDINNGIITLKNNYQLIKALEACKKKFVGDHLAILRDYYKNISKPIDDKYESYVQDSLIKIKIIEKISSSITRLVSASVLEKTDNLLTLILPYFYTYTEFIEEYN